MERIKYYHKGSDEEHTVAFLKKLLELCKKKNIKISVIGGYGLDGLLGRLSYKHNDLDLIAFGKDVNKLKFLFQKNFHFIEINTPDKRRNVLKSKEIQIEIITFELFSLNEKYIFTIEEIFPNKLYGRIEYLQFTTPSIQVHRKIGDMYIDYFLSIGINLDMEKIERREQILREAEKRNLFS